MRLISFITAALFALPAAAAETVHAPKPTPLPCSEAEFHQMDFWLGDWKAVWDGGAGTVHAERKFGGCAIHETFTEDPHGDAMASMGESWSVYDVPNKMWRQTGIGNRGEYYDLTGGPKPDGTFVLQIIRVGREPKMLRAVFEDIKLDSFTWRWQESEDGGVWTDQIVVRHVRTK